MNSKVIKFVAGGGKTTSSLEFLQNNSNGLYLAFNNEVVDSIKYKGFLSKTIDSLFQSFIIPKFISEIPLIGSNRLIIYLSDEELPPMHKNIANIGIDEQGNIFNKLKKDKEILISLSTPNEILKNARFSNSSALRYIFGESELKLTNILRSELSMYIIKKYSHEIVDILKSRFAYIIIDEAQDLKGWREEFAKLLYQSNIPIVILGDDNQNINGGGTWFEQLNPTEIKNYSYRCPENNCNWIRDKLRIDIYGNANISCLKIISISEVLDYDDGKRVLLYSSDNTFTQNIINSWTGEKRGIKNAKGSTIEEDIVIIGKTMKYKYLYTAITRSTKNVFITIKEKDIKF